MPFIEAFQQQLNLLGLDTSKYHPSSPIIQKPLLVIAYSGGLDSHVLLHACHALNLPIRAIHIHHGLQALADDWVAHCQQVCASLNIGLDVLYVDAKARARQSPEDAARIVRYAALEKAMQTGEQLLTAQHADDQSETFLLQLMRGANAAGLAGMPSQRFLGEFIHKRPLLKFNREDIKAYAIQNSLEWIEDPSNQDTAFDRNFIRQNVLPVLKSRWPALNKSLSHAASLQQENLELIEAMAAVDLATISTQRVARLSVPRLLQLSVVRQKNALRLWLKQHSLHQPTRKLLDEIHGSVLSASDDANPCVKWGLSEIRRYQNCLYLLPQTKAFDASQRFIWQAGEALKIEGVGTLSRQIKVGHIGLKQVYFAQPLHVRFRQGGERIQLAEQPHSRRLKSLLQEAGIPPWQRQQIPLIYYEESLIAVSNLWVAAGCEALAGDVSWVLDVIPSECKRA